MTATIEFLIILFPIALAAGAYVVDVIKTAKTPERWRI